MNHASSALADNRLKQLQQILIEATPAPGEPDLRNWEWHYFNRLLRTDTEHKIDLGSGARDAAFRSWNHISENGQWAIRGRQEGEGVVFEVLETPTGKVMGRIPKTGTLLDVSKGNKDLWHFPVLSTDGRFLLLTEAVYQETMPNTPITRRPCMWEVATGTEVAAPTGPLPREMAAVYHSIVVGSGGEWVTWLGLSNAIKGGGSAGPIDVSIHRWEKAKGALPPKTVRVGSGWGRVVLGPDGRTLFWVPQRSNMWGDRGRPEGPPRFEVWDIADTAKLRWSINTLQGTNSPGYQPRLTTALSPSRTSVAILGTDDIAVHSIADGKLLWRSAFPEKRPTTSDVGYRVSDDGERIVCTWDQTITVLERRTPGQLSRPPFPGARRADAASGNERRILYRNRFDDDPPSDDYKRSGQGETLSFYLLPDGKTLVGHDQARGAVRHWDLSPPTLPRVTRSGTQYEFVDGERLGSAQTADGRRTARWGGRVEPTSVIVSADGREYGRIELPVKGERAGVVQSVQFLDAGGRMLVTTAIRSEFFAQGIFDRPNSQKCFLFDIETDNRFLKLAEGNGSVATVPNSRYFWSSNTTSNWGIQDWAGSKHNAGYVDIRDIRTGRPVYEYCPALPKTVATPGQDSFDPTGERVILLTGKAEDYRPSEMADPIVYVNPERIDVVETATGKRLWGVDLTANGGTNRPGFVRFSPDGRYVLVLGTTPQREAYLTVYSATDGTTIWTADSYARGKTSGTRIIGFSPDGRFLAIGDGDAAEVREMQSGKRIYRFTGHLDTPDTAVFTPDNSRLFVSFRFVSSARQAQPRLHVWDLTTGRELITLPGIQLLHRYEAGKLYGDVGVLDGSPSQP